MSPVSLASSTTTAEWDKEGTTRTFRKIIYSNTELGKVIRDADEVPEEGTRINIFTSETRLFIKVEKAVEDSTNDFLEGILGDENNLSAEIDSKIDAPSHRHTRLKGIVHSINGDDALVIFETGDERVERIVTTSLFEDEGISSLERGDVVWFESNNYGKEIVNRFRHGGRQLYKLSDAQLDELDSLYNAARSKKE